MPTLVIGGQASIAPGQAMSAVGEMISRSETFIFDADDGGSHFVFLENPKKTHRYYQRLCGAKLTACSMGRVRAARRAGEPELEQKTATHDQLVEQSSRVRCEQIRRPGNYFRRGPGFS